MVHRDIVVVGASAGGVEALQSLVSGLPATLPVAVFAVLHMHPGASNLLAGILARTARLPVLDARDGLAITRGQIYVAVPDHHLLIEKDRIRLTRGPKENRSRPAVDALFRSAAFSFGPRVIGVVLSGSLDDGTAGLWAVKDRGGIALVQSPEEATFPSMPENALRHVAVNRVLPVKAMPEAIAEFAREPIREDESHEISPSMEIETRIAMNGNALESGSMKLGPLTPFSCPECHGSLVQVQEKPMLRYRCHVGHAFSHQALLASINEEIDVALGKALRAVEERTLLLQKLEQIGEVGASSKAYGKLIADSRKLGDRVRKIIADPIADSDSSQSG